MKQIEHVVLLILENRSFDSMLGWLYENDAPQNNIPPLQPDERAYEGLQGLDLTQFKNTDDSGKITAFPARGAQGLNVPNVAPGESYGQVTTQLFDIANPCLPPAQPPVNPPTAQTPGMNGYVRDYAAVLRAQGYTEDEVARFAPQVMQSHLPEQLPVLNGLAKHYAVCDKWFSSVPSQTNPNRAFAFCGTSMGMADNGFLEQDPRRLWIESEVGYKLGDDRVNAKTIFNAFATDPAMTWKIFRESGMLQNNIAKLAETLKLVISSEALDYLLEMSSGNIGSDYVHRLFPQILSIPDADSHFGAAANLDEFHQAARAGQLPNFTFIEPEWTIGEAGTGLGLKSIMFHQGDDYHPPGNLDAGENLVKQIYLSLTANQDAWNKTLFIITFDEPVGSFDHIPPPAAIPPWGEGGQPGFPCQWNFNFDRYGGRVPAILVSPLVAKGTVFRSDKPAPFDHTSLIATLLKWRGMESQINDFGARTAQAPTFENVISLDTPRTDARDVGFLQLSRPTGAPFHFYDRFYLRNSIGRYVSRFESAGVAPFSLFGKDPALVEYFPTMAWADNGGDEMRTVFYAQNQANRPDDGSPADGGAIKLAAFENGLGAYNVLGAWADSTDCYYFNDYMEGDGCKKQTWIIGKLLADGKPFCFGDKVVLKNVSYAPQCLAAKGNYVTTRNDGSYWTIEPIPDQQPDNTVVTLGQTYYLKHVKSGKYLSGQKQGASYQYYPTLASEPKVALTVLGSAGSLLAPQLSDGRIVTFNSSENLIGGSGPCNQLGAWTSDTYLYYYYHNNDIAKQGWALSRVNGSGLIRVGDPLRVVNVGFSEYMVPKLYNSIWYLSTSIDDNDDAYWVLEKA